MGNARCGVKAQELGKGRGGEGGGGDQAFSRRLE